MDRLVFKKVTFCSILLLLALNSCVETKKTDLKKRVFINPKGDGTIQEIPGRIDFEFYDKGGEGVAYHDSDSVNSGSGRLNPLNGTYLNEFRHDEAVDISYTKKNGVDDTEFNITMPEMESLYLGWTSPEEWIDYTVQVTESGKFTLDLMYTANLDATIVFTKDGKAVSDTLHLKNTRVEADSLAWRQWHHWRYHPSIGSIKLDKGLQTLRLEILTSGMFNLDYMLLKNE